MMTDEQRAKRSKEIVASFSGEDPGDALECLIVALGMTICFIAKTREDAIDMINCIMLDYETDLPKRYDEVQKTIARAKANGAMPR